MIYTILEKDDVKTLHKTMEVGLPATVKIYCVLGGFLKGLFAGFEVLVDTWPEWQCIILRPSTDKQTLPYLKNTYVCHTRKVTSLKYLLLRPGVIDWSKPVTFAGLPSSLVQIISATCRGSFRTILTAQPRCMYVYTKSSPIEIPSDIPKLPENYRLSTLSPEQAHEMVRDFNAWNSVDDPEVLTEYCTKVIDNFDSSCIIDNNGELAAYISMQFNGSMAMLNVRQKHRERSFGTIVLCDLTRKLQSKGRIPYGFLTPQDTFLVNHASKLGFSWVPQGDMTWVHYAPIRTYNAAGEVINESDKESNCVTDFIEASPLAVPT